MNFENKIALVTGGTTGIGKEIVKQLLQNGAMVVINYSRNDELMNQTKNDFVGFKDKITFIKADVSDEAQVVKMFHEINEKFGRLDYLINNAGINIDGRIEDINVEDWKKVIDVNLTGMFICTKYAIPLLKKSESGSIINIASRFGTEVCEQASAYSCSKAGVISLTKTSALELSKYGIRANTVSPGLTLTQMSLDGWSEQELKEAEESNPLFRLGKTTDIANAVLFLLSDKASYLTGENLNVNGGSQLK